MAKKDKDSVYKITEVVGTSNKSWAEAGRKAVETAAGTVRDLRIAEVVKLDMAIENGKVRALAWHYLSRSKAESLRLLVRPENFFFGEKSLEFGIAADRIPKGIEKIAGRNSPRHIEQACQCGKR